MPTAKKTTKKPNPVLEYHEVWHDAKLGPEQRTSLAWRGRFSELVRANPGTFSAKDRAKILALEPGDGIFFNFGAGGVSLIRKPTKQAD